MSFCMKTCAIMYTCTHLFHLKLLSMYYGTVMVLDVNTILKVRFVQMTNLKDSMVVVIVLL